MKVEGFENCVVVWGFVGRGRESLTSAKVIAWHVANCKFTCVCVNERP